MIDEEKISKAAEEYAESSGIGDEYPCAVINTFKEGVDWAEKEFIKSLWHDANEKPKNSGYIITKYWDSEERAMYYELDDICRNVRWDEYATLNCIIQWCYLSDILAKKGGKE